MYKIFHKLSVWSIAIAVVCIPVVLYAKSFSVQVSPNPMQPWEAADMTIKALNSDGSTNTEYQWTILMDLGQQDLNSYDFPSNGFYTFTAEDLGERTFNKWFVVRRVGNYTLKVFDAADESVLWSLDLAVGSTSPSSTIVNMIDIVEPLRDATIEGSALQVVGMLEGRMLPLQFFIDGEQVDMEAETDATWNFSIYIPNIISWDRTLQVKALDTEGEVIAESDIVDFEFTAPPVDWFLQSFTAHPSGTIDAWSSVDFAAQVDGTVRSIQISIGDMGDFIMDRAGPWSFIKSVIIDKPWVHIVDVELIFEWWQRTIYDDRATLVVAGNPISIWPVKVVNNAADPSKISVSWDTTWTSSGYIIRYGLSKDTLSQEIRSSVVNVEIANLDIGKQYYIQVFPVDENGMIIGEWSRIASITTQWQSVAGTSSVETCSVVGMQIRTEKIGDQYFLVWDAITGAVEYHIYKSDFEVSSIETMQKIWTSLVPQFSYPFDIDAQEDVYTYYAVVATCSDGQNLQIDGVKKVHTWPVSDMIVLFFVSLLFYSLYRIYRIN